MYGTFFILPISYFGCIQDVKIKAGTLGLLEQQKALVDPMNVKNFKNAWMQNRLSS